MLDFKYIEVLPSCHIFCYIKKALSYLHHAYSWSYIQKKKIKPFQWQKEGSEEHANISIVALFLMVSLLTSEK